MATPSLEHLLAKRSELELGKPWGIWSGNGWALWEPELERTLADSLQLGSASPLVQQ